MIDSNWCSHGSNGRNPDWFGKRRLFFEIFIDRVGNVSLKNFTTYWQQRIRPIVLQKLLIFFLMNRHNIWLFPVIRTRPTLQTVLENYWQMFYYWTVTYLFIYNIHIYNDLRDISSYLCALLIFKECIILRISWSLNEIDDKLALVTGVVTRGKVLFFDISVRGHAYKFNINLFNKLVSLT